MSAFTQVLSLNDVLPVLTRLIENEVAIRRIITENTFFNYLGLESSQAIKTLCYAS